ncbi:unnamed protein product [Ascophyllum nodosum]
MKVAVYSHSIPPSVDGVARRMTSLLYELAKDGHEVFLFTLEKEPLLGDAAPPGSKPIRFATLASTFLALYPTKRVGLPTFYNQLLIHSIMLREKPDVLHCTMDAMSPFLVLSAKLLNIPIVGSVHTDVMELLSTLGVWPMVGWAIGFKEAVESRLIDSCATTSPSFQKKLCCRGVRCPNIIKTGVKVGLFTPQARSDEVRDRLTFGNPDGLLVVYVGRLGPEKRMDKLIQMCASVDGVYLALIGDGALGARLAERHGCWTNQGNRRSRGGVYCRPKFLGHKDLAPVYATADVHVSCSQFETLGNTVLEAHASGTTVVVPRAQGFIDTVDHEVDGFFFNGDRLQEGAAQLKRLRDDRALCRQMGERGRAKVQMQSPERVAQDMMDWYVRTRISLKVSLTGNAATEMVLRCLQALVSAFMVLVVIAFWNTTVGTHNFSRNFVRYCMHTRNALGNSSFFNRISNTYKALSNIPVQRDM